MSDEVDREVLGQFGLRLVAVRKSRGVSQEQLALESGIARSYLSGVERGQRNIALINICRLAGALKVPPGDLLNFDVNAVVVADHLNTKAI